MLAQAIIGVGGNSGVPLLLAKEKHKYILKGLVDLVSVLLQTVCQHGQAWHTAFSRVQDIIIY